MQTIADEDFELKKLAWNLLYILSFHSDNAFFLRESDMLKGEPAPRLLFGLRPVQRVAPKALTRFHARAIQRLCLTTTEHVAAGYSRRWWGSGAGS